MAGVNAPSPARPANRPFGLPFGVALVALALLIAGLWMALALPLVDPDEGRNAEVGREMAESGDLVIPHLAGMPYLDKPPALFWAEAAFIRVLGATPLAARLPALLAALATLLVLARVAARALPAGGATAAAMLLAGAPLFLGLSAYVIFDMPLTLCVTLVWTRLVRELDDGPAASRRAAMFAAVALGILLKGPVMLAWAVGGSLGAALLLRSRAPLRWLAWAPGWAIVLALAGGWFALALARHPEYARYAFLEESFERLTSGSFKREQPWWFVPAVLVGGALPWSLVTPWKAPASRATRVALGFALFAAVFFTLSRSKLVTYLLPAFPALALWAAESWSTRRVPAGAAAPWTRGRRLALAALALAPALALLAFHRPLAVYMRSQSGAPLAEAIARTGLQTIRYEGCYSPGTDFLLRRRGKLVSESGHEITSNYQVRYRSTLIGRGQWTPLAAVPAGDHTDVIVRSARAATQPPQSWHSFFRDDRFVAYQAAPP